MTDTIQIVISGPSGSGKSAIALHVAALLRAAGLSLELCGDDFGTPTSSDTDSSILERVPRGTHIQIGTTEQTLSPDIFAPVSDPAWVDFAFSLTHPATGNLRHALLCSVFEKGLVCDCGAMGAQGFFVPLRK